VHRVRIADDEGVQGQARGDYAVISDKIGKFAVLFFVAMFFAYLFGPLVIMSITAFNSAEFPRVSPWDCFTIEWFHVLVEDDRLMNGLRNSFIIGLGVVLLAVPIGLAGALMLMQVGARVRPWYYTIVVSPILIPGVVLGISTLIFWDRLGAMFNANYDSVFYDGIFLTIIGQTTFISAYAMLVFISRLQRFDPALEEAALDLGASHVQTFRKILLPFLKPAIASAAVLAFLASFENYNTTVFTITSESTLTTVLASKVRYGINPSISALAVVIVVITLFAAAILEIKKRRTVAFETAVAKAVIEGTDALSRLGRRSNRLIDPAFAMIILIFLAGIGTSYYAGSMGVDECKAQVREAKRIEVQQRIDELRQRQMFQGARPGQQTPATTPSGTRDIQAPGTEGYQGIFAPGNLGTQGGGSPETGDDPQSNGASAPAPGTETYQSIFTPQNLGGQQDGQGETPAPESESPSGDTQSDPGTQGYQNIFAPANLQNQVESTD
jgi:spermidine/putrescine transport system permease protein